ncbi:peptidase domain-containing ABC transporter [Rhizobium herbae]|uniref:Peptidase domain-containing ABC transporter n=1 Tax=Rhizobium herbae TaxID=508661 RepID=A0ABS7HIU7_9HYPH|nr:peptidase domain-containing ABC transporter [Rhizobium herbae]MBW9066163.1 peptidase domain-containing ABC transporter [Rhizobium herbae]
MINNATPAKISWFTYTTSGYTGILIELMIVAVVLRLFGLVQPFVFQTIIDRVLPFQREATLVLIVGILVLTAVFSAGLDALATYLGNHMANRLIAELARRIFRHVLGLPLRFLERWQVGETLARIEEIDTVRAFLTGTVSGVALDVLFAATYIIALFSISPFLTVLVLVMLPLQIVTFGTIGPFLRGRMQESFAAGSRHQSRLVEAFGNAVTVKALASEQRQAKRFQETLDVSLVAGFRVAKLNILNGFLGHILENGSIILIIFFGSRLVFQNEITLGELIAFHLLADKVSGPILSLSSIWEQWQGLKVARLRLGDFLNTPTETDIAKPRLRIDGRLTLRLNRLSFSYTGDQVIIRDMSAVIEPNRPTVIVGESGSGKSTLAKLIAGLYEPDDGSVEVNNLDLSDYDPQSVRRTIAYLPQEPVLFSGSILDNLLAKPDATGEEIQSVLIDSGSDRVVMQLPNGIDTDVGERGGRLSGGQRQRIALARALLTNPQALILDEPTSALDAQSAAIIVEMMKRFARDRTLVVVTHNPHLLGTNINVIDLSRPAPEKRWAPAEMMPS